MTEMKIKKKSAVTISHWITVSVLLPSFCLSYPVPNLFSNSMILPRRKGPKNKLRLWGFIITTAPFKLQSLLIVLHIECCHLGNLSLEVFYSIEIFRAPVSYRTVFRRDEWVKINLGWLTKKKVTLNHCENWFQATHTCVIPLSLSEIGMSLTEPIDRHNVKVPRMVVIVN